MLATFVASKMGKELKDDPEYLKRLKEGMIPKLEEKKEFVGTKGAKLSVILFLFATVFVVLLGSFEALRPGWIIDGKFVHLSMPNAIEMVMLTIAALIIILCKPNVESIVSGNVFKAGATAVVAIFGIAWMGDTFFNGNLTFIQGSIQHLVTSAPWLFAIALFVLSILLYSKRLLYVLLCHLAYRLVFHQHFLLQCSLQ